MRTRPVFAETVTYNVWVKLKILTLDDSRETKDSSKDVSKLQADAVDKSHEAKHLKGNSKLNVLTVDDGKKVERFLNKLLFFQRLLARRHWVDRLSYQHMFLVMKQSHRWRIKQSRRKSQKKRKRNARKRGK